LSRFVVDLGRFPVRLGGFDLCCRLLPL